MIGFLQGIVNRIETKSILVLTSGGVGYSVFPTGSLQAECKKGQEIEMFIETVVREQEISLYGFVGMEEKTMFQKLLSISGIGPKMGLQILSQPLGDFQAAIEQGDVNFITRTPGVGKKMAQKLIVELQGKLDLSPETSSNTQENEALEALVALGYDKNTIKIAFQNAPTSSNTEELIKYFLSQK